MQTYRTETIIMNGGALEIKGLPFHAGDKVEVVVRGPESQTRGEKRYPLRGQPVQYADPFNSVSERDWDALK